MAHPADTRTTAPLAGFHVRTSGPPGPAQDLVTRHLRLLGAEGGAAGPGGRVTLTGARTGDVSAATSWGEAAGVADEATVQAATGIMAVHGRRDGAPRGLALDYVATATGILAVQGLLAGQLALARGGHVTRVEVSAQRAALLAVSQYLAAAGAEDGEAVELGPGGPPFRSAEGTDFELETLDPSSWAAFWRALGAPEEAIRRGWRPFQFRYATACAPFPPVLHDVTRASAWARVREAAHASGAQVCPLRSQAEWTRERRETAPWDLTGYDTDATYRRPVGAPLALPLSGLTVLEAGRRIQAPLTAHLLGLLGADIVRVEPPGGDPLRGMPPCCSGISARWLALNRGKKAVEVDIKSAADRKRLRAMSAEADVFVHNWAPGKAAELGLDHEHLAAVNPALVYAYTSGFADRVPDAPMGTDFMVQARTGVGEAVRSADEAPAPSLMTVLDVLGGLLGAEAILAGLLLRERTGRGVRVDSSLLGAADVLTAPARTRTARGLPTRRPAGFRRPLPTADGWIAPTDTCAAAAARHDLRTLPTGPALELLRAHGLTATAVTTDLAGLPHDARFAASITRDAHGAPAVPAPWSFT
ncbi:CoA transferase [Streptomyces sp. SID3343]|uniref:CoA transferase n=1 Tax=Streptomyces sp. SID3343 TaxID=2690260 RepID=UPI0013689C1A|nr:CoA transferase [Streptomyces sp. SID3343]MYW03276.1 CoA transferase [Streptomyces sp. SID3343]